MNFPVLRIVSLCGAACSIAAAQSASIQPSVEPTQQSIEARLQGPILMLRGMYGGVTLTFDAQGDLIGSAESLPFSMSALKLNKVRVNDSAVDIECLREGLKFEKGTTPDAPESVSAAVLNPSTPDIVAIKVARDRQNPDSLGSALNRVFAVGFDDFLANTVPDYWQLWLRYELHPENQAMASPFTGPPPEDSLKDRGIQPPRVVHAASPNFNALRVVHDYEGAVTLGLTVDTSGVPQNIFIVHPSGMGFDEVAVETARRYKFAPAKKDGKPVSARINIAIAFKMN
jgi:TonB family protein